jgi:YVTN family beta-propeller protein
VVLTGGAVAFAAQSSDPRPVTHVRLAAPAAQQAAATPQAAGMSQAAPVARAHAAQNQRRGSQRTVRPPRLIPTTSSPIAASIDGRYVWSVNPGGDTVSVIRTQNNRVVATIRTGDEPQAVALDPTGRYAFVANAAGDSVTVISQRNRRGRFAPRRVRSIRTGAEPWNVVVSPDGLRAFVANSGQDTITVLDAQRPRVLGHVDLADSRCNDPDRARHFQPRGLAVNRNSTRLYVTAFFAFTRPGGRQADDTGREGAVCRLTIDTESDDLEDYRPARRITLAPQVTGFTADVNGDDAQEPTSAFPNQLQSIVVRGNRAYLPNIAASPDGPVLFRTSTQAFVNQLTGASRGSDRDLGPAGFLNLHLGARNPEPNKKKLFFANPWAIAFTTRGGSGSAYVVSAASDLLVKLRVGSSGGLAFTGDADTTRYIDLNDPANPATSGANAGKNPQGIAITPDGRRAYVQNFVSRNVSVVDTRQDRVIRVIPTAEQPAAGSQERIINVGAEVFFSSRGNFDRPANANVSTSERMSSEGWQACSSCHFKGLTDAVVWEFATGPRKSVPLNASFNPRNRNEQRALNYSAIFDEIEDFEANIRNVSGPGPLAAQNACQAPPPATSNFDPAHGLLVGDNGDINTPPCVVNAFAKANGDRNQVTVGGVPAFTAMREWVRFAIRTPDGPLTSDRLRDGLDSQGVAAGRALFQQAGCTDCHGGSNWTSSVRQFPPPPPAAEFATETTPPPAAGTTPVGAQFLHRVLRDVGTFNKGVPGAGNDIGANIGGAEKTAPGLTAPFATSRATPALDALGRDYNNDGRGSGFNPPSLLGINALPPFLHNGACETLACVVSDVQHRTVRGTKPDVLASPEQQANVVLFLMSIGAGTPPFP